MITNPPTDIAITLITYALGAASPGPSNLAIMATAVSHGRKPAISFALGVVSGSIFWGILVGFGLSAILVTNNTFFIVIKTIGGLYLLWLAAKSLASALRETVSDQAVEQAKSSGSKAYIRGLMIHLTNPKAILVWISLISISLPSTPSLAASLYINLGCAVIATAVFLTYAIAFSIAGVRSRYFEIKRPFDTAIALFFTYAGLRMLLSINS